MSSADVPTPASGAWEGELPVPAGDQFGNLPVPSGTFSTEGLELDHSGDDLMLDSDIGGPGEALPGAFAAPAPGVSRGMVEASRAAPSRGLELDLPDSAPTSHKPVVAPFEAEPKARKKSAGKAGRRGVGKGVVVALLLVVLLVGGGLALGLTPHGVFGLGLLGSLFGGGAEDNLASEVIVQARQKVALDTYRDHRDAIGRVELAQRQGDKSQGLSAYALYLYELHHLRYGESKQYTAAVERIASAIPLQVPETPALELAAAARALRQDVLDEAAGHTEAVLSKLPGNEDALHLRGEVGLAKGQPDQAISAFQALAQAEKGSARAMFGLARGHLARGELEAATKALDACIEAQPNHVGALLEKAQLAFDEGQVARTSELVAEVEGAKATWASPLDSSRALELKAAVHFRGERLGEALETYREATKLNDRSVRAHLGMGEIFHQRGEEAEALAHFQIASRIAPENVDATLGVARSLIAMVGDDNLTTARKNLEVTLQTRPEEPRVHYLLGKVLVELSHPEDAQAAYEKAIELNKAYLEPYIALADLLTDRARVDEAHAVLAKARREMPNDPRISASLGRGYLERGDYRQAEQQFREALQRDAEYLPALFGLGVVLRRMGRLNDAQATFERLAQVDPRYPGLIIQQGLVLERTGQPERALGIYRASLEQNPEDLDMKLRVAAALVLIDNCDEAMTLLREVVRERPSSAEGLFYQGRCMLRAGQSDDAVRALRRAVELDGNNGDFRAFLGMAFLATGASEHASAELHRALELDPTNAVAYWQRGVLSLRSAAAPAAVRDLERALELAPSLHGVYRPLAQAYDQMRRPADAIRYFELAIRAEPDDFLSHFFLAQIVTDQRGFRAGLPLYARAVEIGRRMEPRPPNFYEALFSHGALLHQAGRDEEAGRVLREYLEDAPSTSVDRAEALSLLRALGRDQTIGE